MASLNASQRKKCMLRNSSRKPNNIMPFHLRFLVPKLFPSISTWEVPTSRLPNRLVSLTNLNFKSKIDNFYFTLEGKDPIPAEELWLSIRVNIGLFIVSCLSSNKGGIQRSDSLTWLQLLFLWGFFKLFSLNQRRDSHNIFIIYSPFEFAILKKWYKNSYLKALFLKTQVSVWQNSSLTFKITI